MRRLIPSPWLSLALFGGWLLLQREPGLGQVLLGLLAAVVMPLLMAALRPVPPPVRRWGTLVALMLRVGRDVVQSGLDVARRMWGARRELPRGTFIVVPLELRDVHALAALAVITAAVPGTVWCELAPDRRALLLHVFNVHDEAEFVARYKADYERPLLEIFG